MKSRHLLLTMLFIAVSGTGFAQEGTRKAPARDIPVTAELFPAP